MKEEKLIRFINGKATKEEKREIYYWLEDPESDGEIHRVFKQHWDNQKSDLVDDSKTKELLKEIHNKIIGAKNKEFPIFRYLNQMGRIAATFLLVVFCLYFLREGFLYEKPEEPMSPLTSVMVERTAKAGEKLAITLPDKSRVILNSLSTISFPSDFGRSSREMVLKGEAFFEVQQDRDLPFKVVSMGVTTTALGTSFNIQGRGGELRVSLATGRVLVSNTDMELELMPGEMATKSKEEYKGLTKSRFSEENLLWKEGEIRFSSTPVGGIFKKLADWYGVEFKFEGEIDQSRRISGLFKNESLEDILTGLGYSLEFDYKIKDKEVTIKK